MYKPVVPLAAVLLATSACGGGGQQADAKDSTPSRPVPNQSEPAPADNAKQPVTLAFGGDTHFEGVLRRRLDANPKTALGPIARTLREADLAMVNLETAVTSRGTPAPNKEFHFRAPITAFKALKSAGVDVTSMANNHGMDYGEQGLADSLAAIKNSGFPTVGIGKNAADAYKPYSTTIKGNRIAVIGATQVLDDHLIQAWTATDAKGGLASAKTEEPLIQAVRKARKEADIVVVHLHWGKEMQTCPLPRQPALAKRLSEAGADVIVGGHAHVPLGGGYLGRSYVHYGLGNFVFYAASGKTAASGVLEIRLNGESPGGRAKIIKARWRPATISGGVPRLLSGAAARNAKAQWRGLRRCTNLTAKPKN